MGRHCRLHREASGSPRRTCPLDSRNQEQKELAYYAPEFRSWGGVVDPGRVDSLFCPPPDSTCREEGDFPEVAQVQASGWHRTYTGAKEKAVPTVEETICHGNIGGKKGHNEGITKGKGKGTGKTQFHGQCYHSGVRGYSQDWPPRKENSSDTQKKGRVVGSIPTPGAK